MCMEKDTNPVSMSWKNTLEEPSCALKIQMWLWDLALITGVINYWSKLITGAPLMGPSHICKHLKPPVCEAKCPWQFPNCSSLLWDSAAALQRGNPEIPREKHWEFFPRVRQPEFQTCAISFGISEIYYKRIRWNIHHSLWDCARGNPSECFWPFLHLAHIP